MPLLIQAPNREERILPYIINAIEAADARRIGMVMAWVTQAGLRRLRSYLEIQALEPNPTSIDIVIGNNPHMRYSSTVALQDLLEMAENPNIRVRVTRTLTTFHPKMIVVQGSPGPNSHLFVGSANLSAPAMGVGNPNVEIIAYSNEMATDGDQMTQAIEALDWFVHDQNSFDINQDFIDNYVVVRPSRNPVLRDRIANPPPINSQPTQAEEDAMLEEAEAFTNELRMDIEPGQEISRLRLLDALAHFLAVCQNNPDSYACDLTWRHLNGHHGNQGHVMRTVPLALKFAYESPDSQVVMQRIRDLNLDANYRRIDSQNIRKAYQNEWNTWLRTFGHDDVIPGFQQRQKDPLTWNSARIYLNKQIGGTDDNNLSQADLTRSMYILAHYILPAPSEEE